MFGTKTKAPETWSESDFRDRLDQLIAAAQNAGANGRMICQVLRGKAETMAVMSAITAPHGIKAY
jgi:hypothetical protein